jgi:hypothetical protein
MGEIGPLGICESESRGQKVIGLSFFLIASGAPFCESTVVGFSNLRRDVTENILSAYTEVISHFPQQTLVKMIEDERPFFISDSSALAHFEFSRALRVIEAVQKEKNFDGAGKFLALIRNEIERRRKISLKETELDRRISDSNDPFVLAREYSEQEISALSNIFVKYDLALLKKHPDLYFLDLFAARHKITRLETEALALNESILSDDGTHVLRILKPIEANRPIHLEVINTTQKTTEKIRASGILNRQHVEKYAISNDGQWFVQVPSKDVAQLWNLRSRKSVDVRPGFNFLNVLFSPDSEKLVLSDGARAEQFDTDRERAKTWDGLDRIGAYQEGELMRTFFSADSKILYFLLWNESSKLVILRGIVSHRNASVPDVVLLDASRFDLLAVSAVHVRGSLIRIAIGSGGRLYLVEYDGALKNFHAIKIPHFISGLRFSPDGNQLAVQTETPGVRIYDIHLEEGF